MSLGASGAAASTKPLTDVAINARFLLPGGRLEGIGRFTDEVVSRLVRQHPECTFHLLFDRTFDKRYIYGPNVVPHVLRPPARHPFLWLAWFEGAVATWLKRHEPSVFLSTDGFTTLSTRTPRVTVFHDLAFVHFPDDVVPLHRRYYKALTPRWIRASTIVAVSEATRDDIAATYGVSPSTISVVPNAVDHTFTPCSETVAQDIRAQYTDGKPYVLFVGALQPRKNLVTLLRAFDDFVDETGSDLQLLLVGRIAWRAGAILSAYQAMRNAERVRITGWVEQGTLPQLYAAADMTVYIPHFEGFGIPVLEAQASGSPVITSSVSSLPEVAGEGALLVDPRSPSAVTEALSRMSADPELRQRLVTLGHRNQARFSWDGSADLMWRLLTERAR